MDISFESIPELSFRDRSATTLREKLEEFRTLLKKADEREQLLNSKYEQIQEDNKRLKLELSNLSSDRRPPTSHNIRSPRGTPLLEPLPAKFKPVCPPKPIQEAGKLGDFPGQAKFQRPATVLAQSLSDNSLRIRLPPFPGKANH
jgi:hypothetical protein